MLSVLKRGTEGLSDGSELYGLLKGRKTPIEVVWNQERKSDAVRMMLMMLDWGR